MKKTIRFGFETNSSSCHTLSIVTKEQYDDWERGKMVYSEWEDKLIPCEQMIKKHMYDAKVDYDIEASHNEFMKSWEQLSERQQNNWIMRRANNDGDYKTYDDWWDADDYLERYESSFTTPSGDKMVAFGKYGHD